VSLWQLAAITFPASLIVQSFQSHWGECLVSF
jgi:hypothetical protein